METANQLLSEIQKVKATRSAAATRRPARVPAPSMEQQSYDGRHSVEGMRTSMERMQISSVDQFGQQVPSAHALPQHPMHPQQQQIPPHGPPAYQYPAGEQPSGAARIPPGARPAEPVPYPDSGRYQQTPEVDQQDVGFPQVCFKLVSYVIF